MESKVSSRKLTVSALIDKRYKGWRYIIAYRSEIDGLRALAVLPVVFFHAGFSLFSGGYIGVDVFFVISGYLITTILIKELDKGTFSLASFYERRARRILPALFFVILSCLPLAYLWMIPQEFKSVSQAFVAVAVFASNILFWVKTDYFASAAEDNPLLHTWTLAVEEQYYIFFPLMLLLLWKFGKNPIFYVILGLSLISFFLAEWGSENAPTASFYLLPFRAWELGTGALCAFLIYGKPVKTNHLLSTLGLLLILYSIFFFDQSTPFPSSYTLFPVLGTALIVLYGSSDTFVHKVLSLRPLVWIGLLSYSAYLWHQPLMAFARIKEIHHPHWTLMLALCFISFLLAYITWRFVEHPFRSSNGSWLNTRSKIFGATAAFSVGILAFGLYGHAHRGVPERFSVSNEQLDYIETALPSPTRSKCHANESEVIQPEDACWYNNPKASVAVIGDSHTVELSYALAEKLEAANIGVVQFSFSGCAPSYVSTADNSCSNWTENVVDYVSKSNEFEHVIVSYRLAPIFWGAAQATYPHTPRKPDSSEIDDTVISLKSMLSDLHESDKNVVFVDQSPELPEDIHHLIYFDNTKSQAHSNDPILGVSRDWWDGFINSFESHDVIPDDISRVKSEKVFCDSSYCYGGRKGDSFYFDEDHPSVIGAGKISSLVIDKLNLQIAPAESLITALD